MDSTIQKAIVTVVVVGFPKNLRVPQPLPGETLMQCVIRNHPREWQNCVERLEREFGLPADFRARFLGGRMEGGDSQWARPIEDFMNHRLPSHGRTLRCLAALRDDLAKPPLCELSRYSLAEILVPREKNPNPAGDAQVIELARQCGAKIIWLEAGADRTFFLSEFLARIQTDFAWIVQGGTRFTVPLTAIGLGRALEIFSRRERLAIFSDQLYTTLYRTQAIHEILKRGEPWPHDVREQGLLFQRCGFEAHAQKMHLAELEPIYGGAAGPTDAFVRGLRGMAKPRPWWRRLFGA